ncbi:hypothetical protein C0993_007544 [Termitomyces sp. T159_Od127]|nr:hypothetical protein C0993_007544 [Termitomyces sp. T159_Od127]
MGGSTIHVLLTGATGYIGGSVLTRLLSHKLSDTLRITALVRDATKAMKFRAFGVNAVLGSNSDLVLLQQLAANADVVFACADADDLSAARAILSGLKERFDKTQKPPALIHTSGTGVLIDNADGQYAGKDVYSDFDLKKLESLPDSQPHRDVDLRLVDADNQGYVKTYIVLPGTIYGLATGPLVESGLQNAHSQQIPAMVKIALQRGEVGYVGLGKNVWPHVHIKEGEFLYIQTSGIDSIPCGLDTYPVTDLFILIFDQVLARKELGHGREGFYFGENGEYIMWNIANAVGQTLYDAGKLKHSMPSSYTEEEMRKFFPGGTMFGTNSRCRGDRSREIGWEPKKGYYDLVASIKDEI